MTIKLKPEQERIIQAEIETGHFHSPDEVLDHAEQPARRAGEHRHYANLRATALHLPFASCLLVCFCAPAALHTLPFIAETLWVA
jgi:hypothetical protein